MILVLIAAWVIMALALVYVNGTNKAYEKLEDNNGEILVLIFWPITLAFILLYLPFGLAWSFGRVVSEKQIESQIKESDILGPRRVS